MADGLEVQLQRIRSAAVRPPTLLRAEHVWVSLAAPIAGREWVPGVLQEWRRNPDGEWVGHVTYARIWWQESDREPSHWAGFMSTEWIPRRWIRRLHPLAAPPT